MGTIFEANYHSRCESCGDRIEPGDSVTYEDDHVIHSYCDDQVDPDQPRRTERCCPDCFTTHAGECI